MLEYLQKLLTGPDSVILTIETEDYGYERAGIIAVDQTGIVFECREEVYCFPWSKIVLIQIED